MASGILATGSQTSLTNNTTRWWAWGAQMVSGASTEPPVQSKIRGTATLQNMRVSVASNSIAATSTVTSRKNTAAGNLSVSITASTTGVFSDTTHTDSLVAGDLVCVSSVMGVPAGSLLISGITAELNGASITIFCGAGDTGSTFQTSANYTSLSGGGVQTGTEANRQNKMPVAGTLSNLQMNVATGPAATTTVRLRKNGANGNQVLSITAGTTGIVEDTTNSDSVALNDLVTVSVVMASGASGTANLISTKFVPTTASATPLFVGAAGAFLTNPAYIPAIGQSASSATEANVKVPAPIAGTLSMMTMFVQVNSAGVSTTFTSRKNGAAGNQTISVTAAATGQFQDTTHSDTLAAGDVFNYQCSGTGASSVAVTNAGGMFTAGGGTTIVTGAGASVGTGIVTGVGSATTASVAASAGLATLTGVAIAIAAAVGSISGTGTATAGSVTIAASVGSVTATGAVSGGGLSVTSGIGAANGVATAAATGGSTASATGALSGTSTIAGVGSSTAAASASSSGVATVTGIAGASSAAATGTSSGIAVVIGAGVAVVPAAGASAGSASVSAIGHATSSAVGIAGGSGTATATGAAVASSTGNATGSSSVSSIGLSIRPASGASAGTGTVTGAGLTIATSSGSLGGTSALTGASASLVSALGSASGSASASSVGVTVAVSVGSSQGFGTCTGIGSTGITVASGVGSITGLSSVTGSGIAIGFGGFAASQRSSRLSASNRLSREARDVDDFTYRDPSRGDRLIISDRSGRLVVSPPRPVRSV